MQVLYSEKYSCRAVFSYNCITSKRCSAKVERTLSRLNNDKKKNKLRNRLTQTVHFGSNN